jgi:hypothetical protein
MAKTIKKKKVGSVKYTGDLASPLIELSTLIAFFGGNAEAARRFHDHLLGAKHKALFDWYSIDPAAPDAWRRLAMSLASDHVPGMNAGPGPKQRGPSPAWADGLGVKLLRAVEDILAQKRMPVRDAIKALPGRWGGGARENLEVRYREARRIEHEHRRLYREWKENPDGLQIRLLKTFAVDLPKHFERLRSEGFKIDEI